MQQCWIDIGVSIYVSSFILNFSLIVKCVKYSSDVFDFFQFDWEGDLPLTYPQRDLIIYEMHIRGFTQHESSRTKYPGTYLGVTEKLDHLKVFYDFSRL